MRRLAAALLAGALVLAGCSGSGYPGSGDSGSGDPGPGKSGSGDPDATSATVVPGEPTLPRSLTGGVDLRRLVVSNPPSGFERLGAPPFGAVDLDRLIKDFSDAPAEDRVILEGAGFEAGYTRGWLRTAPPSFLGSFVFEFADDAGARSARDQFALQNETTKAATRFVVDGVADAVGVSYVQQTEGAGPERVHVITFVRGPRLYQVAGRFSDALASPAETVAFARIEDQIAA